MARNQLFYTIDQITENLYTSGSEYQLQNGNEYIGLYHKYITGEVYTEPVWNEKKSLKLQKFEQLTDDIKVFRSNNKNIKTKFKTPEKYFPIVTEQNIKQQYITRYFLYKINDKYVIEINQSQYKEYNLNKLDSNIYAVILLKWYVAGEPFDVTTGNIKKLGVINNNLNTINIFNLLYPGFNQTVNNPLELYVDTTVIVPPDIN